MDIEFTKSVAFSESVAIQHRCKLLPPGFPILSEAETGQVLHESTIYLAYRCLGRIETGHLLVSPYTVDSLAYDHRDFLRFLISRKKKLDSITAKVLYDYAATMTTRPSPVTGEPYAQSTVARRVRVAVDFAEWLCRRNCVPSEERDAIFDLASRLGSKPISMGGSQRKIWTSLRSTRVRSTLLPMPSEDHEPAILTNEQVSGILLKLSTPRSCGSAVDRALTKRNHLMVKLSLCAGLRREEVCHIALGSLAAVVLADEETRLVPIRLTKTKNSRVRKVLIPASLVRELQRFVEADRKILISNGLTDRHRLNQPVFPALIRHRSKRPPWPMTGQNFNRIVRNACMRAGLVKRVPVMLSGGRMDLVEKPICSVHDFRHTYAVWTYLLLRANGDPNPWLYLQAQLGHRSSQTTIDVYLRAVRVFEVSASDRFLQLATEITGWAEN